MPRKKIITRTGDVVVHLDGELRFIGELNVINEKTGEAVISPAIVYKGNDYYRYCEKCRVSRYACSRADAVWLLRYYRIEYETIKAEIEKCKMKMTAISYSNNEISKGNDALRRELDGYKKATILRVVRKPTFPYFSITTK